MGLPEVMPADAESQVSIYRKYSNELFEDNKKMLSTIEELRAKLSQIFSERDKFKMKWEIECERYNDLIEKVMDKI